MTGRPRSPRDGSDGDEPPPNNRDEGDGLPPPNEPGNVNEAQEGVRTRARSGRVGANVDRRGGEANTTPAPDFSDVAIDSNKITAYAMNPDHPVGGNKYRVINSATGLDTADGDLIDQQIRDGVRDGQPILGKADQYGQRWAVDVSLTGPAGTVIVRTAWILDAGSTVPRLVTISFP